MEPASATGRRRAAGTHETLRYGCTWEDAEVLCEALDPVARRGRVLSVAGAGDNVLALLTLDPVEVIAVDVSVAQLAALELRILSFRQLGYDALLSFLGVLSSATRNQTYLSLRGGLSVPARQYWDMNLGAFRRGIIHCGRFERYLGYFRRWVFPLIHSRRLVDAFMSLEDQIERESFYDTHWNSALWRLCCRAYFSSFGMTLLGRHPNSMQQVTVSPGRTLLDRARTAFTAHPPAQNPYITYVLFGNYTLEALPYYLTPFAVDIIRRRVDRIRLVHGRIEDAVVETPVDAVNLSDIFEPFSDGEFRKVYDTLARKVRRGGRLVYWTLFVGRAQVPTSTRTRSLVETAMALQARNRAASYGELHIDEIV
jgi:S-adenosylmethionine-diacylglycerol 3-amino-3-carboxypropyl transferase